MYGCEDIPSLQYDAIYIASAWALDIHSQLMQNQDIPSSKVVDYTLRLLFDMESLGQGAQKTIAITGNSYAFNAFHSGVFTSPLLNLSMSSQDLETDFALLRRAIQYNGKGCFSHVLLGLYHYIFDYQYTKRKEVHAGGIYSFLASPYKGEVRYQSVFTNDLSEHIRNGYTQHITLEMVRQAEAEARFRSEKQYESSQQHNEGLLEEMVGFIQEHGMQPVFVVIPMHSSYVAGITGGQREYFYAVLERVATRYGVPLMDGLELSLPDAAFADATHLNRFGSMLFSQHIAGFLKAL